MFNFFKITFNTFKEAVREPVYFLMLFAALLLIGHTPAATLYVFSEQLKLVVDSSMATGLIFGLIVAVLSASYTVTREMRNGTVLLLLSKPVYRWTFVLGKITGISLAVTLFTLLCNLGTVIAVYIATDQFRVDMGIYYSFIGVVIASAFIGMAANYWRGCAFPEIATYAAAILIPITALVCILTKETPTLSMPDLYRALILINFSVIAMSTLAVVFATRLDIVANLSICAILFFLGLVSSYLFHGKFYSELEPGLLKLLFDAIYAILPNWQYFWLADAIAVNRAIPWSYLGFAGLYMMLYVFVCAMWAVAIFQNKEIAGENRI